MPPRFIFYVRSLLFLRFKEISSKFYSYCHIRSIQAIINNDCDDRAWGTCFVNTLTLSNRKPLLAAKPFSRYLLA